MDTDIICALLSLFGTLIGTLGGKGKQGCVILNW